MKIGEAAKKLGINPRTLRYYERIGLVPEPGRMSTGYRAYSPQDIERVAFIRKAQLLGLSLGEIEEIMTFRDRGVPPCGYVQGLLRQKRGEIQSRIDALHELNQTLGLLLDQAATVPPGNPEEDRGICHLIEGSMISNIADLRKDRIRK
ncbi:MAG: MerR family transcriptional regulator [Chloroflexi bacterium]|nr:MerR family transcriptional regulator [Chloroflexota bacterium]